MLSILSCFSFQSALYPKECIRTCLKSGSRGSHSLGQKCIGSSDALHVFLEPPFNPWTNTKSTAGSEGLARRIKPYCPRISSGDAPAIWALFWLRKVKARKRDVTVEEALLVLANCAPMSASARHGFTFAFWGEVIEASLDRF